MIGFLFFISLIFLTLLQFVDTTKPTENLDIAKTYDVVDQLRTEGSQVYTKLTFKFDQYPKI